MSEGLIKFKDGAHWYKPDGKPQHDADLRVARKAGLYPSITTIDKAVFKNDFLDRWKMNQLAIAASEHHRQPHESPEQYAQRIYEISLEKATSAAEFGHKLHDALDRYPIYPEGVDLHPWIDKVAGWAAQEIVDTYHTEKTLLDHDIGVAGRTDRIFAHKRYGLSVLDWKTQDVKKDEKGVKCPKFYDSWLRQLAFYAVSFAKEAGLFPSQVPTCISVVIDSNEPEEPFVKVWEPIEVKLAYDRFLVGAWMWFEGGGKRKPYWPVPEWNPFDRCPPRIS